MLQYCYLFSARPSALHGVVLILVMLIFLVVIIISCVDIDISAQLFSDFSLRLLHRRPKARATVVSLRVPESPRTVQQASWPCTMLVF